MPVKLNHTIVSARDSEVSARFYAEVFGLAGPRSFGPFVVVDLDNEVSLDFIGTDEDIEPQHYAFLITEPEFDEIFGRVQQRGLSFWADPARRKAGEINHHYGGRGVYFEDPAGHFLEIITRPYGSEVD